MKLGIYMDLRNPVRWRRPWRDFYGRALDRIRRAEAVGLDSVWFTEHHFWEDGYLPQPLTLAASAAAVTDSMRIGTAVVLAPLRPAVDIAEQAALIDLISGGRFELGLGAGYCVPEFRAYGADPAMRFSELESRIVEVRRLWDDGLVTPPPLQDRIPIWVGGFGPRAARIAARTGEGLLYNGPEILPVFRDALVVAGRDPGSARMSGTVNLVINDDPDRAWPRIAPHFAYQWETYAHYGSLEATSIGASAVAGLSSKIDPETLRTRSSIVTPPLFDVVTPGEAVRRIREWMAPLPITHAFFWDSIGGMPDDLVSQHIELLGTQVAPALRDL